MRKWNQLAKWDTQFPPPPPIKELKFVFGKLFM